MCSDPSLNAVGLPLLTILLEFQTVEQNALERKFSIEVFFSSSLHRAVPFCPHQDCSPRDPRSGHSLRGKKGPWVALV